MDDLVAVVLAAGAGTRLAPLTELLPKALCPVGNVALVDWALERVGVHTDVVAVNVHAHPEEMDAHLAGRVHLSHEEPHALGTAGALGALREWIAGRDVLVVNADTWTREPLEGLLEGWDRTRTRLLCQETGRRADFGTRRYVGSALLPWSEVEGLAPVPSGLYEVSWGRAEQEGRLETVTTDGAVVDCGTPREYLEANLLASDGESVLGEGAVVHGRVHQCVLWPRAEVGREEDLRRVIRVGRDLTVRAEHREKVTRSTRTEACRTVPAE